MPRRKLPLPYRDHELDDWIAEFRKQKLTIPELSELTGISRSCLYNWENGKTRHPKHVYLVIAWEAMGYRYVRLPTKGKNR